MRTASCHPDKKHYARGLCRRCYGQFQRSTPEKRAKINEKRRAWGCKNPERHREQNKRWYRTHPESRLFMWAKRRAKESNIPFSLTLKDIVIPATCPVLGILLSEGGSNGHYHVDSSPSLDRINPNLGYIPGNVVVMSYRANMIKNCGTVEEHHKIANWMERNS